MMMMIIIIIIIQNVKMQDYQCRAKYEMNTITNNAAIL